MVLLEFFINWGIILKTLFNQKILPKALSAAVLVAAPLFANAALGNLNVRSNLGEPLSASIQLSGEEAQLAVQEPSSISISGSVPVRAQLTGSSDSPVLIIGSGEAVNQPIVNLVVKIGGNSRQYAVLLDPPKMTPSSSQVKIGDKQSAKQPSVKQSSASRASSGAKVASGEIDGDRYVTRPDDTVISIARRIQPDGMSLGQTMKAIVAKNPQAFLNGDPNKLKKGVRISLPSNAEIASADKVSIKDAAKGKVGTSDAQTKKAATSQTEESDKPVIQTPTKQQKAEQEKAAKLKAEQEKAEQEKAAKLKAEQEKAEQEKAAKLKAEQEKAEQEKAAQQKAEQEKAGTPVEQPTDATQPEATQSEATQSEATQSETTQTETTSPTPAVERTPSQAPSETDSDEKSSSGGIMSWLPYIGGGLFLLLLLGFLLTRRGNKEKPRKKSNISLEKRDLPSTTPTDNMEFAQVPTETFASNENVESEDDDVSFAPVEDETPVAVADEEVVESNEITTESVDIPVLTNEDSFMEEISESDSSAGFVEAGSFVEDTSMQQTSFEHSQEDSIEFTSTSDTDSSVSFEPETSMSSFMDDTTPVTSKEPSTTASDDFKFEFSDESSVGADDSEFGFDFADDGTITSSDTQKSEASLEFTSIEQPTASVDDIEISEDAPKSRRQKSVEDQLMEGEKQKLAFEQIDLGNMSWDDTHATHSSDDIGLDLNIQDITTTKEEPVIKQYESAPLPQLDTEMNIVQKEPIAEIEKPELNLNIDEDLEVEVTAPAEEIKLAEPEPVVADLPKFDAFEPEVASVEQFTTDTTATFTPDISFEAEPLVAPVAPEPVVETIAEPVVETIAEPPVINTVEITPEPAVSDDFAFDMQEDLTSASTALDVETTEKPVLTGELAKNISDSSDAPLQAKLELAKMYLSMNDDEGAMETLYDLLGSFENTDSPIYKEAEELLDSITQPA